MILFQAVAQAVTAKPSHWLNGGSSGAYQGPTQGPTPANPAILTEDGKALLDENGVDILAQ